MKIWTQQTNYWLKYKIKLNLVFIFSKMKETKKTFENQINLNY